MDPCTSTNHINVDKIDITLYAVHVQCKRERERERGRERERERERGGGRGGGGGGGERGCEREGGREERESKVVRRGQ